MKKTSRHSTLPLTPPQVEKDNSHLRFGSALRLHSESVFVRELSPFGITPVGFRALLRALRVPWIELGDTRLVDSYSFFLALRAILRIGQLPFLAPGCTTITRGGHNTSQFSTSLDESYFTENFHAIACDLLFSQKLNGLSLTDDTVKTAAREAARRMLALSLQTLPPEELASYDREAISRIRDLIPQAPFTGGGQEPPITEE